MRVLASAGKAQAFEQTLTAKMCCVKRDTGRNELGALEETFVLLFSFSD